MIVCTSPCFHNNSDVRRHIPTHTTHRPVFAEIRVVLSVLAVQQKKADGKVDSFPWTHGLGTHQTVGEPTESIGRKMEYQYLSCTNIQTHPSPPTHPCTHAIQTHRPKTHILVVGVKKPDGQVVLLHWTHGEGTHQPVGEPMNEPIQESEILQESVLSTDTNTHPHEHTSIPTHMYTSL